MNRRKWKLLLVVGVLALVLGGKSVAVHATTIKQTRVVKVKLDDNETEISHQTIYLKLSYRHANYYVVKRKLTLKTAKSARHKLVLKPGRVIKVVKKRGKNAWIRVVKSKRYRKSYYVKHYQKWLYSTQLHRLTKQQKKVLLATTKKWRKNLTSDQRQALKAYTGHAYLDINAYYRKHKYGSTLVRREGALMTQALGNFSLPYAATYYRGTTIQALKAIAKRHKLALGGTLQDLGFASTTISREVAEGFAHNYVLILNVPANRRVGAYIATISDFPAEEEFLVQRKTKFVITQLGRLSEKTKQRSVIKKKGKIVKHTTTSWKESYPIVVANAK